MYRTARNVPFRIFGDSFWRSISQEHGGRDGAKEFVLSRTIPTAIQSTIKSMQMQIVDALSFGQRSEASSLLRSLVHGNYSLRANDFVYILRYCARSPDALFVMETLSVMEEKQISLDSATSLLMMRALCKAGYIDEAFNFINFLGESQGSYPLMHIFNTFLGVCAKMKRMDHAIQCLDLMDRRMVGKNEVTYLELLKLAVWQKNLSAAQEIQKEYIMNYSLNLLSLGRFIWAFTRLGDLKSAYEALQKMIPLAISGSTSIEENAEGKWYISRLDIPIPSKNELGSKQFDASKLDSDASCEHQCTNLSIRAREHETLLNLHESEPVVKLLTWSFNDVIHGCAYLKSYWLVEILLAQMQKLGLQQSSYTYDGFIKAVVSKRGFTSGMEVLKIMKRRDLKVLDRTLAILSISCSKALELDLAEAMLLQISNYRYALPFNAFFVACDRLDQPERAIRGFAKMRKIKVKPDIKTYEVLFSLFGTVNARYEKGNKLSHVNVTRRIKAIEMDMANYQIQHSHLSMKNLLRALGAEQMISELFAYLHWAESLFSCNRTYLGTPIYNVVLHSLVEAKESLKAFEIFKSMKLCGMSPNDATYNIMIDSCALLQSFRSAGALLSMMIRDGFYPKTMTFTALMKILLRNRKFNEALDLLEQASSEGIKFDVLLFNTILRTASQWGRIDVIEFVVEQMRQENIKPDASTCEYVFSAYVKCGFYSTAMEALQVLSMRMLCEEYGNSLPEEMEVKEDLVLAEDEDAESRILQLFENFQEGHVVALLSLRWSAMLGDSISLSPDQSPWVRRLSVKYGTTE